MLYKVENDKQNKEVFGTIVPGYESNLTFKPFNKIIED